MKALTLEEVVAAMDGTCNRAVPPGSITGVTIDSRSVRVGELFIAIRGERFDGHDFVGRAFAAGALAAVVRSDFEPAAGRGTGDAPIPPDAMLIRVDDPISAMGSLARYYRRGVMAGSTTVVAVTGSNGKTTTKMMIAHLLSGRRKGRASIKSYNNNIGVPLTLLSAEPTDTFLICEVGMNAPGEIAALGALIEPDIAVVTSVAEAHLERLGSLQQIAEEKLTLLSHLQPGGFAVVNVDTDCVRWMLQKDRRFSGVKRATFGAWPEADLRLTSVEVPPSPVPAVEFTLNERFPYRLGVHGRHNACNAVAAIGVARRFGMDHDEIAERLATFTLPAMRLEAERIGRLTLINDAYNANPASLAAGIGVLKDMPASGRRVLVIGDMRELGEASEALHRQAAEGIAAANFNVVIAVGEFSRLVSQTIAAAAGDRIETHAYATTALARKRIVSLLKPNDTVMLKGSRAIGLEGLIEPIRTWAAEASAKRGKTRAVAI